MLKIVLDALRAGIGTVPMPAADQGFSGAAVGRYEPLRRQGPFEGSFRQRRSSALRAVVAGEQPADVEAVDALARDGLVAVRDGLVSLPSTAP